MIVGAGPSGLMMACALAGYGIPFRIIDKKSTATQESNATWIQTRTLELLDQLGILNRFIKVGHACNTINLYAEGKQLSKLSLEYINSIYPFILMLPQSKTEKILETYLNELNQIIERSTELIDIKLTDKEVTCTLKHEDGQIETATCDWLVACDGANSIVREKSGIHFIGEDVPEQCMVADATIDFSYIPKDEIHFFFDKGTVLAAFPLGENRYRLAGNLHTETPRTLFTKHEVIEMVQERAHGKYYVKDVHWVSPFWIHGKVSKKMKKGPVFLVGDAAHIHSPAGGQGMNTAMQDAYNLAWKLAFVIKGEKSASLLDTYEIERNPIIKNVVKQNEYFTKLALFENNFLSKLKKFSQKLSKDKTGKLQQKIGNQITQLDIQYKKSPIINYKGKLTLPQPGQRAPDVIINNTTFYHYLNNNKYNIIFFSSPKPNKQTLLKINSVKKLLEEEFPNLVKCYCIIEKELTPSADVIIDSENKLHNVYQIKKPTIYIIRPDTYIAYCTTDLEAQPICKFLSSK